MRVTQGKLNEKVPHFINASDLCVAPYSKTWTINKEFSPIKLYSYLSCGKPVVTTDVKGVADVIKSSGCGLVVPSDDVKAMAVGILKLFNGEAKKKKMGKLGRKYILKNCTWKKTAEEVLEVLEKAMK